MDVAIPGEEMMYVDNISCLSCVKFIFLRRKFQVLNRIINGHNHTSFVFQNLCYSNRDLLHKLSWFDI